MKQALSFFCMGILLLWTSACTEINLDSLDKTAQINTSVVFPLGQASATILDIVDQINDPMLQADTINNYCYIHLNDTVLIPIDGKVANFTKGLTSSSSLATTLPAGTLFPLSGTDVINTAKAAILNSSGAIVENYDYDYDYNEYENSILVQRIDSMHIKSATLHFNTKLVQFTGISPTNAQIEATITFPNIPELSPIMMTIDNNSTTQSVFLKNFMLYFDNNETKSLTHVSYRLIVPSGKSFTFTSNSDIQTTLLIDEIDADKAWGFFNRSNIITQDFINTEIPNDFFKYSSVQNNKLLFHNPIIKFDIESNVGIPLSFTVDYIKAIDSLNNEVRADFNGSSSYTISMNKPLEGYIETTECTFSRTNGRTNLLFTISPERFIYEFHVSVDHTAALRDPRHFLFAPSFINMYIDTRLPFQFDPTSFYAYSDTINDADISKALEDLFGTTANINIQKMNVNITFTNSLPAKAEIKALFLDENNQVLHIEDNILIDCPNVDVDGFSTNEAIHAVSIQVTDKIKQTKKIVLDMQVLGKSNNDKLNFRLNDRLKAVAGLYFEGSYTNNLDSIFK